MKRLHVIEILLDRLNAQLKLRLCRRLAHRTVCSQAVEYHCSQAPLPLLTSSTLLSKQMRKGWSKGP